MSFFESKEKKEYDALMKGLADAVLKNGEMINELSKAMVRLAKEIKQMKVRAEKIG